MDNYFSNVPLFKALLAKGIGAMGTARPAANGFPKTLDVDKDQVRRKLEWNHLCGEIIDEEVLALLWQDNNSARLPFTSNKYTKSLAIPTIINDYNQHMMGGVDIADQLRSNYSAQQKSLCN